MGEFLFNAYDVTSRCSRAGEKTRSRLQRLAHPAAAQGRIYPGNQLLTLTAFGTGRALLVGMTSRQLFWIRFLLLTGTVLSLVSAINAGMRP
jgi:hypothetical protein